MPHRPENPFGSRFTRPGILPFILPSSSEVAVSEYFLDGESLHPANESNWVEPLVAQVRNQPLTAVVGPHGCGKTTLLSFLQGPLEEAFSSRVETVTLRIGESQSELWQSLVKAGGSMQERPSLLVLHGFEQLDWWGRTRLYWSVKRLNLNLLVTSHRPPARFVVVLNLLSEKDIAWRLTKWLLRGFPNFRDEVKPQFETCWKSSEGNVRQLWGYLYDWFEHRLRLEHANRELL